MSRRRSFTEPGQIARRGGILDLFPPAPRSPVRIDFFGDEIDAIRPFDPAHPALPTTACASCASCRPRSCRCHGCERRPTELRRFDLGACGLRSQPSGTGPSTPMAAGSTPPPSISSRPTCVDRPATLARLFRLRRPRHRRRACRRRSGRVATRTAGRRAARRLRRQRRAARRFAQPHRLCGRDSRRAGRASHARPRRAPLESAARRSDVALAEPPRFAGRLGRSRRGRCGERLEDGWRVAIATDQVDRLTELFEERDIFPRRDRRRDADAAPLPLASGHARDPRLRSRQRLVRVRSRSSSSWPIWRLFGFRKQTRRAHRRRHAEAGPLASTLVAGRVRRPRRLRRRHLPRPGPARNRRRRARVPAPRLRQGRPPLCSRRPDRPGRPLLRRRRRPDADPPRLRRVAADAPARAARRARDGLRADPALRQPRDRPRPRLTARTRPGTSSWPSSFPYAETPDQQASDRGRQERHANRPSRWTAWSVGDVGFGKTEVALRAAFKAVNDGRQVAVLVPTTVLALQHFTTFSQRLAAFPVRVEMLSRLRSKAEQREVLAGSGRRQRRHRHRHPPAGAERRPLQEPRPGRHRRGAALRRAPEGVPQAAAHRGRRADDERDADPAHAAHGAGRHPRHQHDRHRAAGAPADPHIRHRRPTTSWSAR